MKHAWLMALALVITSDLPAQTIVRDGKSDYVIVLAQDALPANQRAAAELNAHLKQMSGVELPIVDDSKDPPPRAILIGASRFVDPPKELGNDGFLLRTQGEQLIIAGPGPRGSMYGVSEVLKKLGVRWFTPKVTLVPRMTTIELPALDEKQTPAFEYREPFFVEAWDRDWAARNRVIGHHAKLDESTGGNIRYADFVHSFDRLVPPELYAQHPKYFPFIDGKRRNGYVQRCLTNPNVLKLVVAGVKKGFADNPDTTIFSVSQNDCASWCTCEECNKIAEQYGGVQSGLYLWFVNKVAEQIEKDLGPEKLIDTLAYQFTEKPPTGIKPRHNVRVRLCPIAVCEAHPYEECPHGPTKDFVANLAAWASITDTLYIWHYNTNFGHYLAPFPDFKEFPADTKLYRRSGVKGIFFQGMYQGNGGGSDAELRSWVMSRCLWNPDVDSDALVTEWMQGVYGPAWEPMRKWFDLMHAQVAPPNVFLGIYVAPTREIFSEEVLNQADKLFDQAEKLAQTDLQREYLKKARLSPRYVRLMLAPRIDETLARFIADVRSFGITHISEGQTVEVWEQKYREQHGAKKG